MTYSDIDRIAFSHWSRDIVGTDPHTLEDMREHLERFPEIAFVSIPHTYIGYESTLVSDSNHACLLEQFPDNVVYFGRELHIRQEEFFEDSSEIVDIYFTLKNDYPVFDDTHYSDLEFDTLNDHVFDEMKFELEIEYDEYQEFLDKAEISISEYCIIDNDGSTPYMSQDDFDLLVSKYKEVM